VSGLLHPVGPQPAAVYWRRRLVLLAVLAVVLYLGARAAGLVGDAAAGTDDVTTPGAGLARPAALGWLPASAPAPVRSDLGRCPDARLRVGVMTTAARYAPGEPARLRVTVSHTGSAACARDLGPEALRLVVSFGDTRLWQTGGCAPARPDERRLEPGEDYVAEAVWPADRAVPGCSGWARRARPGTYATGAELAGGMLARAVFTLG
jgi:hypothetical protein